MAGFFYHLGKKLGPPLRKANWVVQALTGTDADALRAEYDVGRDLARAFLEEKPADPDPAARRLLDGLGARLAGCLADRQRHFAFRLVQAPDVNAFALPGGFVFVTRPLLELCQGDVNEVAFVLGHEMGHVVGRHAMDRVLAGSALGAATARLPLGGGLLGAPLRGLLGTLLRQGYSQDQELEADRLGVQLVRAAGFDATAAGRLLARLGGGPAGLGEYFASHPPVGLRIQNVNRVV